MELPPVGGGAGPVFPLALAEAAVCGWGGGSPAPPLASWAGTGSLHRGAVAEAPSPPLSHHPISRVPACRGAGG